MTSIANDVDRQYWDVFFADTTKDNYEWYCDYQQLRPFILPYLRPNSNVLIVGCGNSPFSAQLYDDTHGPSNQEKANQTQAQAQTWVHSTSNDNDQAKLNLNLNITNTDISPVCIRSMLLRHLRDRPSMKWIVQDSTSLAKIKDHSQDTVLDKACMYAMMRDRGTAARKMLKEIHRVLKPGGVLSIVTLMTQDIINVLIQSPEALNQGKAQIRFQLLKPCKNEMNQTIQPFHVTLIFDPQSNNTTTHSTTQLETQNMPQILVGQQQQRIIVDFSPDDVNGESKQLVQAIHMYLVQQQAQRSQL